jgi:hypothetical protein
VLDAITAITGASGGEGASAGLCRVAIHPSSHFAKLFRRTAANHRRQITAELP